MEAKKSPEKDLSRLSSLFISFGFMLSLTLVLTAFEWKTAQEPIVTLRGLDAGSEEILEIPVTEILPPKPVLRLMIPVETTNDNEETLDIPRIDLGEENVTEVLTSPISGPEPESTEVIFTWVEENAAPIGGLDAFYKFVSEKLSGRYPPQARRMGIEGRVFVEFVVERDGSLTGVKVSKGIGGGCDELAVRVVESAPRWNPGKQRGKPVRQRFTVPIIFKLG